MKNRLIIILVFILFAQWANAQKTIDKIIATIGSEPILLSEVEDAVAMAKARGDLPEGDPRCVVLENLMTQKLMVAQAKLDSLKIDFSHLDETVERSIKKLLSQYGNEKAIEQYFQKPMDKIREMLFETEKEQLYTSTMMREIVGKLSATPSEVEKYYKKIPKDSLPQIPDQYVIYQIAKKPNSNAAIIAAKQQLLELRKRIIDGERFQSLATLYSEDEHSARRGGDVGLSPLETWTPAIREVVKNLRTVGQVSQIVESEYGFHIVQLIEKQANGMVNYRHILIKPKYTTEDKKAGFSQLDSIARLIKSDSLSFERAVQFYSDDEQSRMANGLLVNTRQYSPRFYKDELNLNDFYAMEHLETNELSAPFQSTDNQGNIIYKIIKVKEFIPSHLANLKDDYDQIYNAALQQKNAEAISAWVKRKQKTEYIRIDEGFRGCDFEHKGWFK